MYEQQTQTEFTQNIFYLGNQNFNRRENIFPNPKRCTKKREGKLTVSLCEKLETDTKTGWHKNFRLCCCTALT